MEEFITKSRGFYYNYSNVTPGIKVASSKDLEKLLCATKNEDFGNDNRSEINTLFYDYMDGKSAKRIAEYFIQIA